MERHAAADPAAGLFLAEREGVLTLTDGVLSLCADFAPLLRRIRPNALRGELLVRAAKAKDLGPYPTACDMTAGFGEDSFLLAAAGFSVTLFENDPVIFDLLADAHRRAKEARGGEEAGTGAEETGGTLLSEIASRMTPVFGDSIEKVRALDPSPDIILLDPMFPERTKSGLVGKKFQLLQKLERPCADGEALLAAALSVRPKRIIIKRPVKGPYLGGRRPDFSYTGKTVRWDVVLPYYTRIS